MQKLTRFISTRVSEDTLLKFIQKCETFGGTTRVLRELIHGFVEDRVTIKPPKQKGLYDIRKK